MSDSNTAKMFCLASEVRPSSPTVSHHVAMVEWPETTFLQHPSSTTQVLEYGSIKFTLQNVAFLMSLSRLHLQWYISPFSLLFTQNLSTASEGQKHLAEWNPMSPIPRRFPGKKRDIFPIAKLWDFWRWHQVTSLFLSLKNKCPGLWNSLQHHLFFSHKSTAIPSEPLVTNKPMPPILLRHIFPP